MIIKCFIFLIILKDVIFHVSLLRIIYSYNNYNHISVIIFCIEIQFLLLIYFTLIVFHSVANSNLKYFVIVNKKK